MKSAIKIKSATLILFSFLFIIQCRSPQIKIRIKKSLNEEWKFHPGDAENAFETNYADSSWRILHLPHDWSIEGKFSNNHPATPGGGALPGGIGWYRKSFTISESEKNKLVFIDFDGIYCNSEVWINGEYLGKRPNGYISFRYDLTPYLKYSKEKNVIAVKVDNSLQPNSRWYSGSGIYRNVWLTIVNKTHVDHRGTFITTKEINKNSATININTTVRNCSHQNRTVILRTTVYDKNNNKVVSADIKGEIRKDTVNTFLQEFTIDKPDIWDIETPDLYKAVTTIIYNDIIFDDYETNFGIRSFEFDREKGFILNGRQTKILGVCNHHDLGCLGTAINTRALERQLEILKEMGCNGIRTAHNPPAPELLELCDKMGFIVMDEAYDMWEKGKSKYDYHLYWKEWHKQDLEDMILRDRNHPSVFIWSVGNEVMEQWDKTDSHAISIAKELVDIVKSIDDTRPVTCAFNGTEPENPVIKSWAFDLIGYNYSLAKFPDFLNTFPGQKFIAAETTSSLNTRGSYDMPSDSIRRWPYRWDQEFTDGNKDNTCSSYDNCSTPWGSTHEETWKIIKKYDFLSGMYIWTGFDYLGEPTPYTWPSRSSYFGIVDLCGFPKDAYYMYQSEWTEKDVLHIFPHWNWEEGDTIDVWAYTNCDKAELFLNGKSMGLLEKKDDDLHIMWRLPYVPGTLKATGMKDGRVILTKEINTADEPVNIILEADRNVINADGKDLSFVTVKIVDKDGNLVPDANNLIQFHLKGEGFIAGVDNGNQTSHEPFKANFRKVFNGMCLIIIQSNKKKGDITLKAASEGLASASIVIESK